ncbi:unnamed protein product [Prorocentrum cordatum]|uniref:Phosphagen kinase C-terminal domain-containing protein n=1 Tax=Prorocentrum cordatum TaxID=2364126 RepID=A0ABN9PRS1_9DINO|nr:unnamed protein product [Polarella glacialis]
MVELRLEALDSGSLPKDCYVSMRVGDTQRLSKLAGTRTFRFPSGSEQRLGKIEIFKRIGACSIDVEPAAHAGREVRIACTDNVGELGLRVHQEAGAATKQEVQDQSVASKGEKMKAYREYLSKHGLEVLISEAMSAVLRQRPDQPVDFLVERLKQGKPFPVAEKPVHASVLEKPAPVTTQNALEAATSPSAQQAQSPVEKQPGKGAYYATHVLPCVDKAAWSSLYAAFSRATRPKAATPEAAPTPSPLGIAAAAALVGTPPSVGTWLVSRRKAPGPINPVVPLLFPGAGASRPQAPFAAASAASGPSAAVATAAPQSPPSSAAAEHGAPWSLTPSVGTWLAVAPKATAREAPHGAAAVARQAAFEPSAQPTAEPAAPWAWKPSVGTWVSGVTPPKAGGACGLVTTCRRLAGLGSPGAMTTGQRVEVERVVSAALLDMGGSLAGEYFPLRTSTSFAMRPGGMSDDEQRALAQAGLLFEAEEADGRGVFVTFGGRSAVWLNAQDHHVTFVTAPGLEPQGAAASLNALEGAVDEAMRLFGYALC